MRRAEFVELLGDAIHTALRKASETPQAIIAHRNIRDMRDEEWRKIVEYVVDTIGVNWANVLSLEPDRKPEPKGNPDEYDSPDKLPF